MITFSEAYATHGPDTLAIAEALGITEAKADRLVSREMNARYSAAKKARTKEQRQIAAYERVKAKLAAIPTEAKPPRIPLTEEQKIANKRAKNTRVRSELREIRARHAV